MRIVVLGWGSLCWDPRRLQIRGDWHSDGPRLPVEFARISGGGRLTLVLSRRAKRVIVLWAEMNTATIYEAIDDLKKREGTPNRESIGWVDLRNPSNNNCNVIPNALDIIREWATGMNIDAVIWTDLPTNFHEKTGMEFNEDNVIKYLRSLDSSASQKAKEYVRKAPRQIRTRMRDVIENRLHWTYSGEGL